MAAVTTELPITISDQAQSFIERIGQQAEFRAMLEHVRRSVSGLRSIEVVLDDDSNEIPAGIVLWVHRDNASPEIDSTQREWIDWMLSAFPPEVCQNFTMLPVFHDDGR
jgi:hypothetical protein